jgi:hypothetical protein
MPEAKLDWNAATVKDSTLSVAIEGAVPKGWKQSFETTVRLLGGGGEWGEVKLGKGTVAVSEVAPGAEEKLKHFLESVVAQANADHREPEDEGDGDDSHDEKQAESDGPDSEMTNRFRSFGGDEEPAEDGPAED